MNVAITAEGPKLTDKVSSEFDSCKYLLIVNVPQMSLIAIQNKEEITEDDLAGKIIDADCEVVITGKMHPPLFERLVKACITRYRGVGYTVEQALDLMDQCALKLIRNYKGTDELDGDDHRI